MNRAEKDTVDAVISFVKNKSLPAVDIYDIEKDKIGIALYTHDGVGGTYLTVKGNPLEDEYVTIHDSINGHRLGSVSSGTWFYTLVPLLKGLRY